MGARPIYLLSAQGTTAFLIAATLGANEGGRSSPDTRALAVTPGRAAAAQSWADYDADGRVDLFLCDPVDGDRLLRNAGAGRFVDETERAQLGAGIRSSAACWSDFDRDGVLDLARVCASGALRLDRGQGDGSFAQPIGSALPAELGAVVSLEWIDFDGDGFEDLSLGLAGGRTVLLRSLAGLAFERAELPSSEVPGVALATQMERGMPGVEAPADNADAPGPARADERNRSGGGPDAARRFARGGRRRSGPDSAAR